jgi:hypothetical protein
MQGNQDNSEILQQQVQGGGIQRNWFRKILRSVRNFFETIGELWVQGEYWRFTKLVFALVVVVGLGILVLLLLWRWES